MQPLASLGRDDPKVAAVAGDDRRGSEGLVLPSNIGAVTAPGGIDTLAHLKSFFMELSWPCSCSFTSICSSSSLCSFFFELSSLSISSSASSTCRFIAFKRKLNCKGWVGGGRVRGRAGCELAGRPAQQEKASGPDPFSSSDKIRQSGKQASCESGGKTLRQKIPLFQSQVQGLKFAEVGFKGPIPCRKGWSGKRRLGPLSFTTCPSSEPSPLSGFPSPH